MKSFNLTAALLFVFVSTISPAMVRVIPQNNYGKATESRFDPITDHLTNLGALIKGQPMGGAYDIVYSVKESLEGDESKIMVLQCPSIRECQGDDKACMVQEKFWKCEELYESSPVEACTKFRRGKIAMSILDFIAIEVAEGVITAPIAFFKEGIGLAYSNISTAKSVYTEVKEVINMSCSSMQSNLESNELSAEKLFIKKEIQKGDVQQLVNIFTPQIKNRNKNSEFNGFTDIETSKFPLSIQLTPPTDIN